MKGTYLIKLDSKNHTMREKSIQIHTIFGDVYAPKSRTKILNGVAYVPAWVFIKAGLNPCQVITGYMGGE